MNSFDAALIEARNPETTPERLRRLSQRKEPHERARLREVIATNPNVEKDLLLALAADYPKEVISNPRFQLLELSGEAWWENCDLLSLCALVLFAGPEAVPCLKPALRSLFHDIYNQYSEMVSIKRQETWCYQRSVEILSNELNGLPAFDVSLDIELCALMEGKHDPWLEVGDSAASFSSDWICSLLRSLRNECIESLFDTFGRDPCEYIVVEDELDESVELSSSSANVKIDGLSVLEAETGQEIFSTRVYYECHFDGEPKPRFECGVLHIPVSEHVGGDCLGVSRDSSDDLGDLEPLWGWEPKHLSPSIPRDSWEQWLSEWIFG
jgi:hypothetical protein